MPKFDKPLLTRFCVFFAIFCLMSLLHRYFAINHYTYTSSFAWHIQADQNLNVMWEFVRLYWDEIFLGWKSDVLFSLMAALFLFPFERLGVIFGIVALTIFYPANLEHLIYNDSSIDLAFLGLALDPTFIKGQTTAPLIRMMFLFGGTGMVLFVLSRWNFFKTFAVIATPVLAVVLAIPAEANLEQPIWLQSHPLAPKIGTLEAALSDREFKPGPLVDGNPSLVGFDGKYNVLLVFLEGISEYSLAQSNMSTLNSLAEQNIHFKQYLGHQMITANGLYASHTGWQPYVTGVAMRWYGIEAESPETKIALPQILNDAGYQTAFLQSSNLEYMRKGITMSYLGYDVVIGEEAFDQAYSRNGWGVDDLTLVEGTLDQIDTFDQAAPWLTTILTTGTHSPYNAPDSFEPETVSDRTRAIRYADYAVKHLMDGLAERDLLKNTVVIITADEARETSPNGALESEIVRNWLPLIVIHPDKVTQTITDAFSMIDLRNLILTLTGDFDEQAVERLVRDRDVFVFGNVRLDRMFYYDRPEQEFFVCNTDDFVCNEYEQVKDIRDLDSMEFVGASQFPKLQTLVEALESDANVCDGNDPAVCE
ncbi:MAG: LTA synthase family protein [Spongiibacteraceae bacterium]